MFTKLLWVTRCLINDYETECLGLVCVISLRCVSRFSTIQKHLFSVFFFGSALLLVLTQKKIKKKIRQKQVESERKANEKRIACLSETNYRIASEKSRKRNENLHIFVIKILFFVSLLTRRRRQEEGKFYLCRDGLFLCSKRDDKHVFHSRC